MSYAQERKWQRNRLPRTSKSPVTVRYRARRFPMNRVHAILRVSLLVLAPLCLCACHKINPAPPETPAPPQQGGREFVYAFDNDAAGKIAARFHGALTGGGASSDWSVKVDPTAPSQPNVMAQ